MGQGQGHKERKAGRPKSETALSRAGGVPATRTARPRPILAAAKNQRAAPASSSSTGRVRAGSRTKMTGTAAAAAEGPSRQAGDLEGEVLARLKKRLGTGP
jgi:hypothetical protein